MFHLPAYRHTPLISNVIKLREANKNVSFTKDLLHFARLVGMQAEACG